MLQENLTLLLIDDKSLTTDLDRAGYRKMGVTIRQAQTFQQAEDVLKGSDIDIVVINSDFKDINGLALCEHFKRQRETANIPIVITSVQDKPKELKNYIKAGMDLFVEQPVPRQFFIEKLRGLLDQKTRENDRLDFDGVVSFTIDEKEISCQIGDISKTGLLLLMSDNLPLDRSVEIDFSVPDYKKPIKVNGIIVRDIPKKDSSERLGYGVRFDSFLGDSKRRLEKYLSKLNVEDPKLIYYL